MIGDSAADWVDPPGAARRPWDPGAQDLAPEVAMSLYDLPAVDADDGPVALARIASAAGLGARWPGQVAFVRADGTLVGSRLGGAVDPALVLDAPASLAPERAATGALVLDLAFDRDEAERAGLPCGGSASVLVQRIAAIPASVRADLAARRPTALVTSLDDPGLATRGLRDGGDPAYDDPSSPDSVARTLLARGEPSDAVVETSDGRMLVTVVLPTPRLVVIGSGSLADALDAQLRLLGWSCAALTRADDGVAAVRELGPGDGVLVVDHRGEIDLPVLSAALSGGVGYVAALGSRRTQEARRGRLRDAGVDDATLARLRGPAGLDVGARTPAEIAVAIVAEMLSVRSSSTGGALRDRSGPINAGRA